MRTLAIIQARTGSTRLPNKVLASLGGKTVLEHVVSRVLKSKFIDEVVVATTFHKEDLRIVELCAKNNIRVFVGSVDDVLDRYYQLAKLLKPENVVRITADCPLIDPEVIDSVIIKHHKSKNDYTANTYETETFPDGEDIEIFKFETLKRAWEEAALFSEREHVTVYIKNNPKIFKLGNLQSKVFLGDKRWTIDDLEDLNFMERVFEGLYEEDNFFGMDKILKFLKENPEIEKINNHIGRNMGLKKSLDNDKIVGKE